MSMGINTWSRFHPFATMGDKLVAMVDDEAAGRDAGVAVLPPKRTASVSARTQTFFGRSGRPCIEAGGAATKAYVADGLALRDRTSLLASENLRRCLVCNANISASCWYTSHIESLAEWEPPQFAHLAGRGQGWVWSSPASVPHVTQTPLTLEASSGTRYIDTDIAASPSDTYIFWQVGFFESDNIKGHRHKGPIQFPP